MFLSSGRARQVAFFTIAKLLQQAHAHAKMYQRKSSLANVVRYTRLLHHRAARAKTWRKTNKAHLTFTVDQAAPEGSCTSGRAGSK